MSRPPQSRGRARGSTGTGPRRVGVPGTAPGPAPAPVPAPAPASGQNPWHRPAPGPVSTI